MSMARWTAIGSVLLLSMPGHAEGLADRLDAIVRSYHDAGLFQGAVLVASGGEVIYRGAFGLANAEWKVPNMTETRFAIASLGKAFTAAMVLQLVDEGRIALEDPITPHLPSYRRDLGSRITIHDLLSHTAGIRGVPQDWIDHDYRKAYTLDQLVALANESELEFEPGTKFRYCNSCYNLLGAMIEAVTGRAYPDELRRRILEPLGMADTGLVDHRVVLERRASGYDRLADGTLANADLQDQSFAVGAGGMYSTIDDLYRWDRGLAGDELLSPKTRAEMFTRGLGGSGYGWGIGSYATHGGERGTMALGFGGTKGFASVLARFLDHDHLVVILGNVRQIPQNALGNDLWNTVLGLPVRPLSELYDLAMSQGAEAAAQAYRARQNRGSEDELPKEADINRAGYLFLSLGRTADAIAVLGLNVALHPESANAHDSLGEAYAAHGDTTRAIASYEKALALDPEMASAKAALTRLREATSD